MSSGWLIINSGSDNGQMYTNTVSYNANGQMDTAWFDMADSYLSYSYYSDNTGSDSNQALQSTTLYPPNDQGAVSTTYTYDSSTKRLATITVNGIVFSFDYQTGSNQINHIYAVPTGGSTNVTDRFSQDTTDPARIAQQVVSANGNALTETVPAGGYNQQDQITGQTITRENSSGSSQTDVMGYGYNPNNADALTSVSDTTGGVTTNTTYNYDGVGNITSTQVNSNTPTSLGTVSNLNQYSSFTYNLRGSVTDDGTYRYGFDANNRLISVTPYDTSKYQLKYGYDSSGRRLWMNVYSCVAGFWTLTYTRRYVWDGNNLVAMLDGSNNLMTGYTWGPNGNLLAVTDYTASGGPKTYMAINDLSGNVIMLIDPTIATGNMVVADYHYDAYGNLLTPNGANGPAAAICGVRGKGLYYDVEAPDIGHALLRDTRNNVWLQRDPSGESSDPDLYGMYNRDPVNKSDSTGTSSYTDQQWSHVKHAVANQYFGFDMNDNDLSTMYADDPTYQRMVDGELNYQYGSPSLLESMYPAFSQQMGDTRIPSQYVAWHDEVAAPFIIKMAQATVTGVTVAPAAEEGIIGMFAADSWAGFATSAATAAWGIDNTQAAFTFRDSYLQQGVTSLTGSETAGAVVNGAVGIGLMTFGPSLSSFSYESPTAVSAGAEPLPANQSLSSLIDPAAADMGFAGCFREGTIVLGPTGMHEIQSLWLGQRTLTGRNDATKTSIDIAAYRAIRLVFTKGGQEFHLAFLRPARQFEGLGAGDTVDLSVMELKVQGKARIVAIEPCPPIEDGPGRIITGFFRSTNSDVRLLKLQVLAKPLEVTGNHPIYSEDRMDFVMVGQLRTGERLRTRDGTVTVESVSADPGEWEVFNLEIDGAHQYYVTERCVLVHNGNGLVTPEEAVPWGEVHDSYVNWVRPGAQPKAFDTPWSSSSGLGSRVFDDFDATTGTGFEGNTTPWSEMNEAQLSRKLDQLGSDFTLLKTDPQVDRVIWFGTEPLPESGLGGQLKNGFESMQRQGLNIQYYTVQKP